MGVATAFVLHEIRKNKFALNESGLFMFAWNLMKYLVSLLIFTTYILDTLPVHYPLFYGILASTIKLSWCFCIAVIILGYSHGFGGFWRDFMSASGWRRLSKLNYGVMMCHIFIYYLLMGPAYTSGMVYLNYGTLTVMTLGLVTCSYVASAILHMLVEIPAANLYEIWKRNDNTVKILQNNNNTEKIVTKS